MCAMYASSPELANLHCHICPTVIDSLEDWMLKSMMPNSNLFYPLLAWHCMLNVTVWMTQIFIIVKALLLGQFWFREWLWANEQRVIDWSLVVPYFWQHTASCISDIWLWQLASLQILQQLHYRISLIHVCISYVCMYVYICENLYTFSVWYRCSAANFFTQTLTIDIPLFASEGEKWGVFCKL